MSTIAVFIIVIIIQEKTMKLSGSKVHEIVRLAEQLYPIDDDEQGPIAAFKIVAALEDAAPERKALYDSIENLSDYERYELIALVWLGRGDAGETPSDWESLVKEVSSYKAEVAASYLVAKSPLAKYLKDGIRKLGKN